VKFHTLILLIESRLLIMHLSTNRRNVELICVSFYFVPEHYTHLWQTNYVEVNSIGVNSVLYSFDLYYFLGLTFLYLFVYLKIWLIKVVGSMFSVRYCSFSTLFNILNIILADIFTFIMTVFRIMWNLCQKCRQQIRFMNHTCSCMMCGISFKVNSHNDY